jgi:hypothetical protein
VHLPWIFDLGGVVACPLVFDLFSLLRPYFAGPEWVVL